MWKKSFLILCLVLHVQRSSSNPAVLIPEAIEIGTKLWKVVDALNNANTAVDFSNKLKALLTGETNEHAELMAELSKLSGQTQDFRNYVEGQFADLEGHLKDELHKLPNDGKDEEDRGKLYDLLDSINTTYTQFRYHMEDNPEKSVWDKFAEDSYHIKAEVEDIRQLVSPHNSDSKTPSAGILSKIAQKGLLAERDLCDEGQSVQQLLRRIIDRVLQAEVQTMTVLSFTNSFRFSTPKAREDHMRLHMKSFQDRYGEYLQAGIKAMKMAPGSFRACDPKQWHRDGTYFELEEFAGSSLQQARMAKIPNCHWFVGRQGWAADFNCQTERYGHCEMLHWISAICRTGNRLRPFQWIKTSDRTYGNYSEGHCNGSTLTLEKRTWASADVTYCACSCLYDNGEAISVSLVQSNVAENKVITGARFVRQDRVLYIQIREGELLPNGQINSTDPSEGWVPLPQNPKKEFFKWQQKTLALKDLTLPSGYALVGIQFVVHNSTDNPVALKVIGQKFDYLKGKVLPKKIEVSTEIVPKHESIEPERTPSINVTNVANKPITSNDLVYLTLSTSSVEYDIIQTVLPLIDGVEVVSDPPTPLGGIGMLYKTIKGHGGLLSLRLYSLLHGHYLEEQLWNYKPGRVFENCTDASCSFDHILDIGEKVYHFMKSMTDEYEEGDTADVKLAKLFTNKDVKHPTTMEFIDMKEKLDSPYYSFTGEDLERMLNRDIAPMLEEPERKALKKFSYEYTSWIDQNFKKLAGYSEGIHDTNTKILAFNHDDEILGNINKLHQFLLHKFDDSAREGILQAISRRNKLFVENDCMNGISVSEVLAQILRTTIATEVKAMLFFSFSSRVHDSTSAWKTKVLGERKNFKDRFLSYVRGFQDAMHAVSEDMRYCHAPTKDSFGEFDPSYDILFETPTAISLAAFNANVSNDMVIGSLRFVIQEGVLFLQPQERKLLPNGMVDPNSGTWIPIPSDPKKVNIDMKHRKLVFGDVVFLPEYAITGLQFEEKNDSFVLQVTARKFDFSNGKLLSKELKLSTDHEWREGINTKPLHDLHPHLPHDSDSGRKSIELELPSSLPNAKPATVFGVRELSPAIPTPLGGIGYFSQSLNSTTSLISVRAFAPRYEDNLLNFMVKQERGHTFVDY